MVVAASLDGGGSAMSHEFSPCSLVSFPGLLAVVFRAWRRGAKSYCWDRDGMKYGSLVMTWVPRGKNGPSLVEGIRSERRRYIVDCVRVVYKERYPFLAAQVGRSRSGLYCPR